MKLLTPRKRMNVVAWVLIGSMALHRPALADDVPVVAGVEAQPLGGAVDAVDGGVGDAGASAAGGDARGDCGG